MAMEWVHGRHLSDLAPEEAMRMTFMSCEAVTAGLVLTGIVHADPHEGNYPVFPYLPYLACLPCLP